ncbi:ribosomal protein S2 [Polyplosphaeria fusca]|uniref:Ribosomal protein S2 n=1 Tax=Polyplosphaeria fusca TaxID=682080 RepID=A0A9P4QJI3_9PLEO|nr:ribosomal protein S2 [Polyplosphaeria fusca]
MIIRQHLARTGSRALVRSSSHPLRRFLSAETDARHVSADDSIKQLHTLDTQLDTPSLPPASTNDSHTHPSATPAQLSAQVAEQYHQFKKQQQLIGKLGSDITPHYQPHTLLNNPPSPADVTLELLLASEAHQGHATSIWNPANARYIHGIRQGTHIISLEVTAAHLRRAAKVVQEVSRRAGMVLFVGTRDGQDRAVVRAAELAKGYHLFERWIPGSITNGQQILGRCKTKVVNEKDVEIDGFDEQLWGRPVLRPDLVVCLNPLENYVLLHECALNNIPTIGVIDTNADPTWVTYPIPANDDSLRCIQVIAGVLGRAGELGQKARLAAAERGEVVYSPAKGLVLPGDEDKAAADTSAREQLSPDEQQKLDEGIVDPDDLATMLDEAAHHEGKAKSDRIKVVS